MIAPTGWSRLLNLFIRAPLVVKAATAVAPLVGALVVWWITNRWLDYDIIVPRVVGMTQRQAVDALRNSRLKIGRERPESISDNDIVVWQAPINGMHVKPDTEVDLFFQRKLGQPTPSPMPGPAKGEEKTDNSKLYELTIVDADKLAGAKFQVDGKPIQIVKADPGTRRLRVVAGHHQITVLSHDARCYAEISVPTDTAVRLRCEPFAEENLDDSAQFTVRISHNSRWARAKWYWDDLNRGRAPGSSSNFSVFHALPGHHSVRAVLPDSVCDLDIDVLRHSVRLMEANLVCP